MRNIRHWSVKHARKIELFYNLFCAVAPFLRPGIAWLGQSRSERLVAKLERMTKGVLFDCHMCGQCTLSASGMVCPMNCGKQLRNGPCGGVAANGSCEVNAHMRCVWLEALEGAKQMANGPAIASIQPPTDHSRSGSSTWLKILLGEAEGPAKISKKNVSLLTHKPESFERACRSGRFVVTAEISPPDSIYPHDLLQRANVLLGLVDAINVTDNAGANCHMSSLAASALLAAHGHTPVLQSACRDRNRIAIQADIMGAAALGVHNLL